MKCEDPDGCDRTSIFFFIEEYDYHFCSLDHFLKWAKQNMYPCDEKGKQTFGDLPIPI